MRTMQRVLSVGGSAGLAALLVGGCMSGAALGLLDDPIVGSRRTGESARRRPPR